MGGKVNQLFSFLLYPSSFPYFFSSLLLRDREGDSGGGGDKRREGKGTEEKINSGNEVSRESWCKQCRPGKGPSSHLSTQVSVPSAYETSFSISSFINYPKFIKNLNISRLLYSGNFEQT